MSEHARTLIKLNPPDFPLSANCGHFSTKEYFADCPKWDILQQYGVVCDLNINKNPPDECSFHHSSNGFDFR